MSDVSQRDSFDLSPIRAVREHPYVGKLFRDGLSAILSRDPGTLPGETTNHSYFCWYVSTRGLAIGVNGGGGKVGGRRGERLNVSGELTPLGGRFASRLRSVAPRKFPCRIPAHSRRGWRLSPVGEVPCP